MNTNKSSLSKITTLIENDFKKYWVLALVEFAIYFFPTSSTLLLNKDKLTAIENVVSDIINPSSFLVGFMSMVFPLVMSVAVFSYLNNVASVTATHCLPISRKEHFAGHLISGYLLAVLPIITNGIILTFILAVKTTASIGALYKVIAIILLISLVTYAFSVMASMLVGTVLDQVFGSIMVIIFIPALVLVVDSNLEILLKGYCQTDWEDKILKLVLPIYNVVVNAGQIKAIHVIWYLTLAAILITLSLIAYEKRPLENATDALVFKFTQPLIVGFWTFVVASSLGEYFISYGGNEMYFLGMTIGIVLGYIFITMICEKTTRIFNKRNIRNAIIFACLMVLFVGGVKFDIMGYVKKIPAVDEIENVQITLFESSGITPSVEDRVNWLGEKQDTSFDSSKSIELIRTIHSQLIEKRERNVNENYLGLGIKYKQKNGTSVRRIYEITYKDARKIPEIAELYESQEFKENFSFAKHKNEINKMIKGIEYSSDASDEYYQVKNTEKILKALDKDFANRTFEQENKGKFLGMLDPQTNDNSWHGITVLKSDKNTIAELKRQGIL